MASTKLTQTKISDTYGGVLHSNGEALPVSTLVDIYDGVGNKSSLKLGRECNGATICGPVVINGSLSANNITTTAKLSASTQFDILNLLNVLQPINSIIFTFNSINPGTRTGWTDTTWAQVSQGRFLVGVGTGTDSIPVSKTFTVGNNTGEYNHTLITTEIPNHTHTGYGVVKGASGLAQGVFTNPYIIGKSVLVHEGSGHTSGVAATTTAVKLDSELRLDYTGGSLSHNNTPPGFGLYVWQRTA
jgi:hypothetical protein